MAMSFSSPHHPHHHELTGANRQTKSTDARILKRIKLNSSIANTLTYVYSLTMFCLVFFGSCRSR